MGNKLAKEQQLQKDEKAKQDAGVAAAKVEKGTLYISVLFNLLFTTHQLRTLLTHVQIPARRARHLFPKWPLLRRFRVTILISTIN